MLKLLVLTSWLTIFVFLLTDNVMTVLKAYLFDKILQHNQYSLHSPPPLASWILHSLAAAATTNFRDEPSWLFATVSEMWISRLPLLFLYFLPRYAHTAQLLLLHLSQLFSVTSISKINGQLFLMETITLNDFHGPKLYTQYIWYFILHWDPMAWW